MLNFDISRTSRKCSVTQRELARGEEFISALVDDDGQFKRMDFCLESWEGAPDNCIGWWKCRIPNLQTGRVYWAPRDVLMAYFEKLLEHPGNADIAFVMSLVLIQKRILRLLETDETTVPPTQVLRHNQTRNIYRVPEIEIAPDRVSAIQDELAEQLFTDHAPDDEGESEEETN